MTYFRPDTDPRLFACGCDRPACDAPAPSPALLAMLNTLRTVYGAAVQVTSGPRCGFWNAHEGGVRDSEHLTGEGADLLCPTSEVRWGMLHAARTAGCLRLGIGRMFLHVGVSRALPQRVVWTYYPVA